MPQRTGFAFRFPIVLLILFVFATNECRSADRTDEDRDAKRPAGVLVTGKVKFADGTLVSGGQLTFHLEKTIKATEISDGKFQARVISEKGIKVTVSFKGEQERLAATKAQIRQFEVKIAILKQEGASAAEALKQAEEMLVELKERAQAMEKFINILNKQPKELLEKYQDVKTTPLMFDIKDKSELEIILK